MNVNTKTVYSYDPKTGVYQGETYAWESPLEPGIFPLPAHSTDVEPPKFEQGQIPVFDSAKQIWSIGEDHRGKKAYDTETKMEVEVSEPGPLPSNLTLEVPPSFDHRFKWDGEAWSINLEDAKAKRIEEISSDCRIYIESGFISDALGDSYTYPSNITDQQNLSASALDSLLNADDPSWITPFWCADKDGKWDYKEHTAKQIQKVAKVGKTSILSALAKKKTLTEKVNAATTSEEVNAITWESV